MKTLQIVMYVRKLFTTVLRVRVKAELGKKKKNGGGNPADTPRPPAQRWSLLAVGSGRQRIFR